MIQIEVCKAPILFICDALKDAVKFYGMKGFVLFIKEFIPMIIYVPSYFQCSLLSLEEQKN